MSLHRSAAAQFFLDDEEDDFSLPHGSGTGGSSTGGGGNTRGHGDYNHSYSSTNNQTHGYSHLQSSTARNASPPIRGKGHSTSDAFEQNEYQDEAEVVDLLTRAAVTLNDQTKLENLSRVKEIIIGRQPALLDNFLDEMLNFQSDSNPDVRRYILEFIENACKTDPETIPKIFHSMLLMLSDPVVSVQKKAIQVTAKIYKLTLMWLCRSKSVLEEMENSWTSVTDLKKFILKQIDSDNDGIRTHTVKFIETVILLQTPSEPEGIRRENDFCLDQVPITVKVARPRKLEEDARLLFEELLKFHGSRHATSVNLMTCMGSIVIIAKLRPSFMGKVVTAMEKLNAILPPTLERSQVTSVRKHMKVQLIGLLKHPRAVDYYESITTLLTDLGATNSELNKAIPNWEELRIENRKRQRAMVEMEEQHSLRKRPRIEDEVSIPLDEDSDDDDEDMRVESVKDDRKLDQQLSEVEKSILDKLTPKLVAELVIASMGKLPDTLPAHFMSSFTPIAIAGTDSQIRHVSRLLAAQITAHQLGTDVLLQTGGYVNDLGIDNDDTESMITEAQIPILVSHPPPSMKPVGQYAEANKLFLGPPTLPGKKKIIKAVKLSELTKPLSTEARQQQLINSVKRILDSEERLNTVKCKLISSIVITSSFQLRYYVMNYIKDDIRNRLDLGIHWIFGEYSLWQGFLTKALPVTEENTEDRYEWTFFNLMNGILEHLNESEKSSMSWRLFTEPPTIPDRGLDLLKILCGQPLQSEKGMQLLMELTLKRPKKLHYLSALLEFCSHSVEEIRLSGIECVLKLFEAGEGVKVIEDKAVHTYLSSLRHPNPPEILFAENLGRQVLQSNWSEDLVRACLHLYLQLLTVKNSLIHELAKVYVETTADVKRGILRYIETPVRKMGMESSEIMKLLDTFPKGAETLVTRMIHILTDKSLPTVELVSRVRGLYAKRVADVRFLIPVLNGLTKIEIVAALPKLIKLNPQVVKEVFNRLLGIHADYKTQHTSPISPVELMIGLHNIEPSKCDVKTVIKATALCFNETEVYSAEVLAVVINQLLEQSPIPTLLMRTVIQTLALHSKLSGFIMNTLTRLVQKQVWTQPKIWEGFIKCCQRAVPKSLPVLLTLPAGQLKQVLIEAPDLHGPLVHHLMSFSEQQRSFMHPMIINTVLGDMKNEIRVKEEYEDFDDVLEVENMNFNQSGVSHIKSEQRSPGREELSTYVKGESMDYNC